MRGFQRPVAVRWRRCALIGWLTCAALVIAPSLATAEQAGSGVRALQAGSLDAGHKFTCAIKDDGTAWCWGDDGGGQLGNGDPREMEKAPVRVLLPPGRRARSVSAGTFHACAVLDDGSAWCWGVDTAGQLGDREVAADRTTPVRAELPIERRAVGISAGGDHTCAILDDRSVWCWGKNGDGQLGNGGPGTSAETPTRTSLPTGGRAIAVSAGGFHTCAILEDQTAWCWGLGGGGALGNGSNQTRSTPVQVALGALFVRTTAISAGNASTCALLPTSLTACWGANTEGQVGNGTAPTASLSPALVGGPPGALQGGIAISAGNHACWTDPSSTRCWGDDFHGQLGDGLPAEDKSIPSVVLGIPPTRQVVATTTGGAGNLSTAGGHTCVAYDDGSATCWGDDALGQLGNGAAVTGSVTRADEGAPALPPGSLFGLETDVSASLEGAPANLRVGESGRIVVRVGNVGPDPASDLRLTVSASNLALGPAAPSQGAVVGSSWSAGTVAAGGQATLTVPVTALAGPSGALTVEVVSVGAPVESATPSTGDVDSIAGNGVAGEDDQATATIAVPLVSGPGTSTASARCTTTLRGSRRNNTLRGTRGSERILGLGGADRMFGSGGRDCLLGGPGNDRLDGGAGDDRLAGETGNDVLLGGAGLDQLIGGAGKDTLTGGAGRDTYDAGAGDDTIRARDRARETIRCGRGRDTAIIDRTDRAVGCESVRRR